MVKRLCMLALAFADFLCYLYQNVILRLLCFCYNEVDFSYPQSQRFSDIKGVAGNCHHSSYAFLLLLVRDRTFYRTSLPSGNDRDKPNENVFEPVHEISNNVAF